MQSATLMPLIRVIGPPRTWRFSAFTVAALWVLLIFAMTGLVALRLRELGLDPEKDFSPVIVLAAFSPLLAALISVGISRIGFRSYFRSLIDGLRTSRGSIPWIFITIFGPILLVFIAALIQTTFEPNAVEGWFVLSAIPTGLGAILAGAIGEEMGWRGFGQPVLQTKLSVFNTSIVIGIVWATWHLWPLLCDGGSLSTIDIADTYIRLVATAVIYGWLFNRNSGLLLVAIAHGSHNLAVDLFPIADSQSATQGTILAAMYAVVALLITVFGFKISPQHTD